MAGIVVLGTAWGDEGKGRFVDYFAKDADYIVRFSGGNNAGHTVVYQGKNFLFTIVPSGAFYQKKLIISAGVCFDPQVLISEIKAVEKEGVKVNLMIDPRAHIVMSYHRQRDVANEAKRGKEGVGSVGFGVGYCFVDRARRENIRFEDLIDSRRLNDKLAYFYPRNKKILDKFYGVKIEPEAKILEELNHCGRRLKKYLGDVSSEISKALEKNKTVLFEGSQGVLLDVNFGTYPYTTGSHIISGYIFPSVGLPPQKLKIIGVVKSFNSRAGGGPFPTEISTDKGSGRHILIVGHEFEEFPGIPVRARRVGWLDLPMLRYAHQLNNFTAFGLTHIDTLAGLKKVMVCTHYIYKPRSSPRLERGHRLSSGVGVPAFKGKKFLYPQFPGITDNVKPFFTELKGWEKINPSLVHRFSDLSRAAQDFVFLIEKETGVPVKYISVGPERKSIIIR